MAPVGNITALSRMAVWYGEIQKDLVLPTRQPIGEYIADVVDALAAEDIEITAPSGSQWTLARPGGPLKPEKSLQEAGISDGAVLELRAVQSTERYREVNEDVIEVVAEAAAGAGRPFDESTARIAGLIGLTVGGIAGCVVQWIAWVNSGFSWGWFGAGLLGALVAMMGVWSATHRYEAPDAATAWTVVCLTASAVLGQAIPVSQRTGMPGAAHIMVAAAAVGVAALCALLITHRHLAATSALVGVSLTVVTVCAATEYTPLPPAAIAAGVLLGGLTGLQVAPNVAAALAQIALPRVPADGESIDDAGGEISAAELAIVRQRASRAVQLTTGLLGAAALVTAVAAVWMVDPNSYHRKVEVIVAVCLTVALCTWGRTLSNGLQAFCLFGGAAVVILGAAGRYLLARPTGSTPVVVITTVLIAVGVLVFIAIVVTPRGVNPKIKRVSEIVGTLALVAIYPLSAWLTGIFGILRDLRIG